jgi:hypothetical protein
MGARRAEDEIHRRFVNRDRGEAPAGVLVALIRSEGDRWAGRDFWHLRWAVVFIWWFRGDVAWCWILGWLTFPKRHSASSLHQMRVLRGHTSPLLLDMVGYFGTQRFRWYVMNSEFAGTFHGVLREAT